MPSKPSNALPVLRLKFDALATAAEKYPEIDVSAVETCITFLSVMSEVVGAFDIHYARHGFSRGRFIVLVLLMQEEGGGLSPAELAERTQVTRATMTGLIDTLAQKGFVERVDNPLDRRMYRVFITQAGRDAVEQMLPDHFRRMAGFMRHLSVADREQLRSLLDRLRQGVDALRDE